MVEYLNNTTYSFILFNNCIYRGADKSLARRWKETSYSDQDLQHCTKTYGVQTTGIYSCCFMTYKQQQYIPVVCTP